MSSQGTGQRTCSFRIVARASDFGQEVDQRHTIDFADSAIQKPVDHEQIEFARCTANGKEQMSGVIGQGLKRMENPPKRLKAIVPRETFEDSKKSWRAVSASGD
jgi:hypothetical protein